MRKALLELATPPEEGDEDYEERMATFKPRPHLHVIRDQL